MNVEEFREYCLSKPFVTESFPFDKSTLVFKVVDKMFALTGLNNDAFSINLKCNPEKAIELRSKFNSIKPGFHMNKKHWNTVTIDGTIPRKKITQLIDHSYELVLESLPKKVKLSLGI